MKKNVDIRIRMLQLGLSFDDMANLIGCTRNAFVKQMCRDLTPERRARYTQILDECEERCKHGKSI